MSCMKMATDVPGIKTSPFSSLKEIPGGDSPNYERPRPCIYPDCPVRLLNALYRLRWPTGAGVLLFIFRGTFRDFYFSLNKSGAKYVCCTICNFQKAFPVRISHRKLPLLQFREPFEILVLVPFNWDQSKESAKKHTIYYLKFLKNTEDITWQHSKVLYTV